MTYVQGAPPATYDHRGLWCLKCNAQQPHYRAHKAATPWACTVCEHIEGERAAAIRDLQRRLAELTELARGYADATRHLAYVGEPSVNRHALLHWLDRQAREAGAPCPKPDSAPIAETAASYLSPASVSLAESERRRRGGNGTPEPTPAVKLTEHDVSELIALRDTRDRLRKRAEAAERRLAELTEAAREATESDSDPVYYALSRVLDRQARDTGAESGQGTPTRGNDGAAVPPAGLRLPAPGVEEQAPRERAASGRGEGDASAAAHTNRCPGCVRCRG